MHRDSGRPRRLRVSSLAAVANPSYTRIDTWNLLDDACRHLAAVQRAGLDTRQKVARAKRLLDRLAAYERYWLYPGAANLEAFRGYLDDLATERLGRGSVVGGAPAVGVRRPRGTVRHDVRRWRTRSLWRGQNSSSSTRSCSPTIPRPSVPESLAESLRALRSPSDDVQFELLVVSSVEDAITAVALNGEIQAAIIRHDLPLRRATDCR